MSATGRWEGQPPEFSDPKASLHTSLQAAREAVVSKLEGLSEYDIRRPLTATGTNLLGLVKHLAISESRYLGEVFGRPFPEQLPAWDGDAEENAEMWATEDESRSDVVGLYRRVWDHADETIRILDLDAPGVVPWWTSSPRVVLFNVLVHRIGETNRHAGHADILNEQVKYDLRGDAALAESEDQQEGGWARYRARVEQAATAAAEIARGQRSPTG